MSLAKDLLDSIDILASEKANSVKFDKTVRATISEVADASIGKYKVKYQNSSFFAYALDLQSYAKNTAVYVVIPSSDFEKDPYIIGSVKKLGSNYIEVLNIEDKMSIIGTNILSSLEKPIEFYSHRAEYYNTITLYSAKSNDNLIDLNKEDMGIYKQDSEYLVIGANFRTALAAVQKYGGDYGIKVTFKMGNPVYKSLQDAEEAGDYVYKQCILNTGRMTGQPYDFTAGSDQKAVFDLKSDYFLGIESIQAFIKNFPNQDNSEYLPGYYYNGEFYGSPTHEEETKFIRDNKARYDLDSQTWYYLSDPSNINSEYIDPSDIFISNVSLAFYDALSEAELQGISLRVLTPVGGYFTEGIDKLKLEADLRIRGKRVNYSEQQVSFYWFVKDNRVDSNSPYFSEFGGPGWRCLNQANSLPNSIAAGFQAGTYTQMIYSGDYESELPVYKCLAEETTFKCVALFRQENDRTIVAAEKIVYNKPKEENKTKIEIYSTMGPDFDFSVGKTTLKCYVNDEHEESEPYNYIYYWSYSIDGDPEVMIDDNHTSTLENQVISTSRDFIIFNCTVYDSEDANVVPVGAAALTLTNGEPSGEYRLVINNGTQVFKYDAYGVSPASPSVDPIDRLDLGIYALSFDIYNDKGQKVNGEEDITRIADIKWVWPTTLTEVNPSQQTANFESMLLPPELPEGVDFEQDFINNPSDNSSTSRWVLSNQAQLAYRIQNEYDPNKILNDIILEVDYKGKHLTASTHFTFTKEGELGTNGTKYTARIVPKDTKYTKIVIVSGQGLWGVDANGALDEDKLSDNAPFKVELWDGGIIPVHTYYPGDSQLTWSTELDGRIDNNQKYLTINPVSGIISIVALNRSDVQNHTVKVEIADSSISDQHFHTEYPIEVVKNINYSIEGGYRTVTYGTDGTRGAYSQKGFVLKSKLSDFNPEFITWQSSWGGNVWTVEKQLNGSPKATSTNGQLIGYNNVVFEPPAYFKGENVNNYITVAYGGTGIIYVIPIRFYLNQFGLAAVNAWDGSSIKLNSDGTNYIMSPQVGAGKKENGAFTGITLGTSMEGGNQNTGLFGYSKGQRSIFLDAETGNAEFGKAGAAQIKIDATTDEGIIQSGDYDPEEEKTGMKIKFSSTGPEGDKGPYIKFGSGNFSVDVNGNLIAQGGGTIGGWHIGADRLTASSKDGNTITLNSNGSLSGPHWSITEKGLATFSDVIITNSNASGSITKDIISIGRGENSFTVNNNGELTTNAITANGGTIAGWNINSTTISKDNFSLNSNGSVKLGNGFSATSSSMTGSGKLGSQAGSNLKSGHVYGGGSGSGGASTDWKDVNVVYSITALTTNNFPTYTDSTGAQCTQSGGTKFVYKIGYNTRKLRLLVSGETSDQSHDA